MRVAGAFLFVACLGVVGVVQTVYLGYAIAQALVFPGLHSPATIEWPWYFLSPLALVFLTKEMREYADKFLERMFR